MLRPGVARYYQFTVTGPLIGKNGGKLRVVFPKVDGAPFQHGNIATDLTGSAWATGLSVPADFTISPPSSNAKLDFASNPTLSLQ